MAEMLTYAPDLRSLTGGQGDYTMEFLRYEEVPGAPRPEGRPADGRGGRDGLRLVRAGGVQGADAARLPSRDRRRLPAWRPCALTLGRAMTPKQIATNQARSPATSAAARCCAASTPDVFLHGGAAAHGVRAVHRRGRSTRAGSARRSPTTCPCARRGGASAAPCSAAAAPARAERRGGRRRPSRGPRAAADEPLEHRSCRRRRRRARRREPRPRPPRAARRASSRRSRPARAPRPRGADERGAEGGARARGLQRLRRTRARSPAWPGRSACRSSRCARRRPRASVVRSSSAWELSLVPLRGRPRRRGRRRARSGQGDELDRARRPPSRVPNAAADERTAACRLVAGVGSRPR